MALLIAEPSPAWRTGIDDMSVAVRGATTSAIPTPKTVDAAMTPVTTSAGGTSDDGSFMDGRHGCESTGVRPSHARPIATTTGPTARKRLAPTCPATVPTRVERAVSRMLTGRT